MTLTRDSSHGPLQRRRALLCAALGFMRIQWHAPRAPIVTVLERWMNSWIGLGAIVVGMNAQGFNVELREFPWGWRANFYPAGTAHSVVAGSAWELTPWIAAQKAAREALSGVRERPSSRWRKR